MEVQPYVDSSILCIDFPGGATCLLHFVQFWKNFGRQCSVYMLEVWADCCIPRNLTVKLEWILVAGLLEKKFGLIGFSAAKICMLCLVFSC